MSKPDILEEIRIELKSLRIIVDELHSLSEEHTDSEPSLREKTAAGSFLAQFYNGVENILKRISRLRDVELPTGGMSHVELFKKFCEPPFKNLPLVFDGKLEDEFGNYRRFRHIVYHGYGFQLKWEMMKFGVEQIGTVFEQFSKRVSEFIDEEANP